jgi:sulfite reductase (NADPH) flavoprotein alpha-component
MPDHQPTATAPPIIPDSAPFTPEQRQWLNGFFAALYSAHGVPAPALLDAASALVAQGDGQLATPWHDPRLPLSERMLLAEGLPIARRMMAAMGQQDCRQCGYDCETYASAIASAAEARLNLCVPGGKDTTRMLKALIEESSGGARAFDAEAYQAEVAAANAPPPRDLRPGYSRDNPVAVRLRSRRRLNAAASEKATYHIEIDLAETGIEHIVGDALGIYPENDPALVDAVIAAIGAPPDFPIMGRILREVLIADLSLGTPPDALLELISYITGGERRRKARQLAAGEDPDGDAATLDVLATVEKFAGIRPDPEAFVESLDPLQPRLYSIASSLRTELGRIALTVDQVRYQVAGRTRNGVGSSWLAERASLGTSMKAYIQRAPHFRLPDDDAAPIIMVGPGTGIAPFRAFLQERKERGAKGPAWLFFGHRREAEDFFYADELRQLRAEGVLRKLSLAWSRDGETKAYVQHRMMEEAEELWDWLFDGAHFYVCGDAQHMAVAVEDTLAEIVADYGNREMDAAKAYIENLKKAGRYHADVY